MKKHEFKSMFLATVTANTLFLMIGSFMFHQPLLLIYSAIFNLAILINLKL